MTTIAKGVNVHVHQNADYSGVGLGKLAADTLLSYFSETNGVLFDFGCDIGWKTQASPTNGMTIPNIAGGPQGSIVVTGSGPVFSGGGLSFGDCTQAPNRIEFAGALTSIQQTPDEEWLLVAYVRLPTDVNWTDPGAGVAFVSFGDYGNSVDFANIYLVNSGGIKNIVLRRGTASGASEALPITVPSWAKGALCQVAGWRKGGRTRFLLRAASEVTMVSPAGTASNSGDFGALSLKVGLSTTGSNPWGASLTTSQLKARNWKIYRGALINLAGVSADVAAGLEDDWARVLSRNVFL